MAKSRKSDGVLAPLPGEFAMLAAVVSEPHDDQVKLVYADWLEEQGDPRGTFLRNFVHAVQKGKKLPVGASISSVWQEMVGVSLLRRLCADGLTEHRARIMGLARPTVAMATKPDLDTHIAIGRTKFGGRPHLPAGIEWPRCDRGPLEFLAQFDLSGLQHTLAGRALPATGLLSFFMYHNYPQDQHGGEGGLRIIHTPDSAKLLPLDPPRDLTADLGRPDKTCRVSFTEFLDLPDPPAEYLLATGRHIPWSEEFGPLVNHPALGRDREGSPLWSPSLWEIDHHLFGYAHVSVLCQDPIPGPEWQLLIRFTSNRDLAWHWGDGHHLFWYIKTDDLKRGHFDDTRAFDG
jgi:uncharacterized protein (TIGR02996 family)